MYDVRPKQLSQRARLFSEMVDLADDCHLEAFLYFLHILRMHK